MYVCMYACIYVYIYIQGATARKEVYWRGRSGVYAYPIFHMAWIQIWIADIYIYPRSLDPEESLLVGQVSYIYVHHILG